MAATLDNLRSGTAAHLLVAFREAANKMSDPTTLLNHSPPIRFHIMDRMQQHQSTINNWHQLLFLCSCNQINSYQPMARYLLIMYGTTAAFLLAQLSFTTALKSFTSSNPPPPHPPTPPPRRPPLMGPTNGGTFQFIIERSSFESILLLWTMNMHIATWRQYAALSRGDSTLRWASRDTAWVWDMGYR